VKRRGTVTNQTGGSGAGSQAFPYLCSDGSRTRCLLWKDITLWVLIRVLGLVVMSVQIRQHVREQPDT
jgi:hypothetical protein